MFSNWTESEAAQKARLARRGLTPPDQERAAAVKGLQTITAAMKAGKIDNRTARKITNKLNAALLKFAPAPKETSLLDKILTAQPYMLGAYAVSLAGLVILIVSAVLQLALLFVR